MYFKRTQSTFDRYWFVVPNESPLLLTDGNRSLLHEIFKKKINIQRYRQVYNVTYNCLLIQFFQHFLKAKFHVSQLLNFYQQLRTIFLIILFISVNYCYFIYSNFIRNCRSNCGTNNVLWLKLIKVFQLIKFFLF